VLPGQTARMPKIETQDILKMSLRHLLDMKAL